MGVANGTCEGSRASEHCASCATKTCARSHVEHAIECMSHLCACHNRKDNPDLPVAPEQLPVLSDESYDDLIDFPSMRKSDPHADIIEASPRTWKKWQDEKFGQWKDSRQDLTTLSKELNSCVPSPHGRNFTRCKTRKSRRTSPSESSSLSRSAMLEALTSAEVGSSKESKIRSISRDESGAVSRGRTVSSSSKESSSSSTLASSTHKGRTEAGSRDFEEPGCGYISSCSSHSGLSASSQA